MTILTVEQAEALATAILSALDGDSADTFADLDHTTPDRQRVASDLAGLRDHLPLPWDECGCGRRLTCSDARRYSDGLLRTADLYGVKP